MILNRRHFKFAPVPYQLLIGAGILVLLVLAACGEKSSLDAGALPAPSASTPGLTNDFPSVVNLNGCTGTYVTPRKILTASHCVRRGVLPRVQTQWGVHIPQSAANLGPGIVGDAHDLAVITFNSDLVPKDAVYPIGGSPKAGDPVTLVGYGCGGMTQQHGGRSKRAGTNLIYRISEYLELYTPLAAEPKGRGILGPSNLAGSCFGDSGGPLFKNSGPGKYELIGIDHAATMETNAQISEYIDLSESQNHVFLQAQGIIP